MRNSPSIRFLWLSHITAEVVHEVVSKSAQAAGSINWDLADGEEVEALIEVRVTPQRDQGFDAIAERIYRFEEVSSVYLMSGAYDLMVLVRGRTIKQLALFVSEKLSTLENVNSTATHFVLKKYKNEGVILEGVRRDERLAVSP